MEVLDIENRQVYIISLDAKDIFISNNYNDKNNIGYDIADANGHVKYYKFINTLDYSLDLLKLNEIYKKIYRRNGFTFRHKKKPIVLRLLM